MSGNMILVVSAMYIYVAFDQYRKGDTGLGIAFFGYALSNLGMFFKSQ
jgi:hypothetical protein